MRDMVAVEARRQSQDVHHMPERILRRKCKKCGDAERKRAIRFLQRSAVQDGPERVPPIVHEVLREPGQPLHPETRFLMESKFGHDFSRVRVHADEKAAVSAASVHAKAFTAGDHIVFGAGKYHSGSAQGRRLLMHELTHVVQQASMSGPQGILQMGTAGGPLETQASMAETAGLQGMTASAGVAAGVIRRDVFPVSKFSPAPGLYVDRTENSISISGRMELYGPEANAARAAQIQSTINNYWTGAFPDGNIVNCTITVTYRPPGSKAANVSQIEAVKMKRDSYADESSITLNAKDGDAYSWTVAHEFGHIVGLDDRFSEAPGSVASGPSENRLPTIPHAGYESNIMGAVKGVLEGKNVRNLIEEHPEENEAPSQYWINDDDKARDWVNGHSVGDVGKLSTPAKLKLIRTLMGGRISDEDVTTIARICSSVSTKTEADAIRNGVDVLKMSDIGQRSMVRAAFLKMP